MDFLRQIKRIEYIDYLIRSRATGNPGEFANKLNISPSQLYQVIKILKDEMGAPIYYSKSLQSYCYNESVKFVCEFREEKSGSWNYIKNRLSLRKKQSGYS